VIGEQSVAQSSLVLQSVNCRPTQTSVRPSSSSCQKSVVHVESISTLPRAVKQERKRQAKTSHTAELTRPSSPYKRALESTKAQASASRPRPKKREAKKVSDVKAKQQKLSKR